MRYFQTSHNVKKLLSKIEIAFQSIKLKHLWDQGTYTLKYSTKTDAILIIAIIAIEALKDYI